MTVYSLNSHVFQVYFLISLFCNFLSHFWPHILFNAQAENKTTKHVTSKDNERSFYDKFGFPLLSSSDGVGETSLKSE